MQMPRSTIPDRRGGPCLTALALGAAFWLVCPNPARAEEGLERQLLKQAPKVLEYLKGKGYKSVGILKFRVKKGSEPVTDNAGPLNLTLAERLELALILGNDARKPLGIVRAASAVAARLPGASHLSAEGRRALFAGRYPLAWGKEEVSPDAFLTGVVQVSPDLKDMAVGILAFGKGGALDKVAQFTAAMDAEALVEAGESFLLRGAFDGDQEQLTEAQAVRAAARIKEKEEGNPLSREEAPVALEVRYDGKRVPLEFRDGRARVSEPRDGQEVTFVLRRRGSNKARYAVVLKVNGENTLYRQRLRDVDCRKWVLDPGDPPITVKGFQRDGQTAERFRVLSRRESKQREMHYGIDVGTMSLTVFQERKGRGKPPVLLNDDAEDLAALSRGAFPEQRPLNLAALKEQLREGATRGLIAEGDKIGARTQRVTFDADPTPIMSATINYYRP